MLKKLAKFKIIISFFLFFFRHKLEKEADLLEKCDNDLLSYLNSEKFEYVINPILEKDGFGPTDEICLGNESNAFIKLNSS